MKDWRTKSEERYRYPPTGGWISWDTWCWLPFTRWPIICSPLPTRAGSMSCRTRNSIWRIRRTPVISACISCGWSPAIVCKGIQCLSQTHQRILLLIPNLSRGRLRRFPKGDRKALWSRPQARNPADGATAPTPENPSMTHAEYCGALAPLPCAAYRPREA